MTPSDAELEKRARECLKSLLPDQRMMTFEQITEEVAKSLRQVRDEAVEASAKVAEEYDCDGHRGHTYDCCGHCCHYSVGQAIRNQKGER